MSATHYSGTWFPFKATAKWGVMLDELGVRWTWDEATRRFLLPDLRLALSHWIGRVRSPKQAQARALGMPILVLGHVHRSDLEFVGVTPDSDDIVTLKLDVPEADFRRAQKVAARAFTTRTCRHGR
jgi:hypothetical protein